MLIDFSVKNYLSIKNEVTLSLVSANHQKNQDSEIKLIPIENDKYSLLSVIGLYGPNASGKSNIIKAFADFKMFIESSHKLDLDESIPAYKPFKLDPKYILAPILFDIEFLINKIRYVYTVELTRNKILKEELHFYPEGRKAKIFIRHQDQPIIYGGYFKGEKKSIEKTLLPNTLFLSKAANSKHDLLVPIYRYFRDNYNLHVRMDSGATPFHSTTFEMEKENSEYKDIVISILNAGDLNIKDIKIDIDKKMIEHFEKSLAKEAISFPEEFRDMLIHSFTHRVQIGHSVYSDEKETDQLVYFDLQNEESSGTIKMYDMAGEIIETLRDGTVLFIDEFNSGLHPYLNKFIVNLFLNPEINKNGAQLIISTHDTCVLDIEEIQRDQIWFTDKDKYGATELFSLDEFDKNKVRNNTKFSKWYLDGRFKAIPLIDYKKFKLWDN